MGYFNGNKVGSVVRPPKSLVAKTLVLSNIGWHMAYDEGVEGFSAVYCEPPVLPSSVKDFIVGNNNIVTLFLEADISEVKGCFQCFPNLTTLIVSNPSSVVIFPSNMLDGTSINKIVVPQPLYNRYVTRYPQYADYGDSHVNLFDYWTASVDYTLPFIGETTLTAEYVEQVASILGPQVSIITHLIVPNDFTEYENGALRSIFDRFVSLTEIDSPWLDGQISELNYYIKTDVARNITQEDMNLINSLENGEGIFPSKLTVSKIFNENKDSSNIFWQNLASHSSITKLECPFQLNTREYNAAGCYVTQPYIEEIYINKEGNWGVYPEMYYSWGPYFPAIKNLIIKYATKVYVRRGNGGGPLEILDMVNALEASSESWAMYDWPFKPNSKCYLRKINKIGNLRLNNLSELYIGTSDCVLTGTLYIPNSTIIYIPRGSLSYYQNATNWSSFASRFVEYDY